MTLQTVAMNRINGTDEPHLPSCTFDTSFVIHNDTLSLSHILCDTEHSICVFLLRTKEQTNSRRFAVSVLREYLSRRLNRSDFKVSALVTYNIS